MKKLLLALLISSNVHAGSLDDIQFTGAMMPRITDAWLAKTKEKYAPEIAYLNKLSIDEGLPPGTLPTMAAIESMMGELNIKNSAGYEGWFQVGASEQKRYALKNPYDLHEAAEATTRLLHDYHGLAQRYTATRVAWTQRSMTDFYHLHQQGFMGSGVQYNAITQGANLPKKVIRNIRANLPPKYKAMAFSPNGSLKPGITHRELGRFYYRMWQYETARIWAGLSGPDPRWERFCVEPKVTSEWRTNLCKAIQDGSNTVP